MYYKNHHGRFHCNLQVLLQFDNNKQSQPLSQSLLQWHLNWENGSINTQEKPFSTEKRYIKLTGQFNCKKLKATLPQPWFESWYSVGIHIPFYTLLKEKV